NIICRDSEFEFRVIRKWFCLLDQSFPISTLADYHRAVKVLQRSGNNFRSGSRISVYQDHHWHCEIKRIVYGFVKLLPFFHAALRNANIDPFLDKKVYYVNRLMQ